MAQGSDTDQHSDPEPRIIPDPGIFALRIGSGMRSSECCLVSLIRPPVRSNGRSSILPVMFFSNA